MTDSNNGRDKNGQAWGFNNLGVEILEVGENDGVEDRTVRPLRESLRKLIRPEDLPSGESPK
jgi:hypothetical protein